MIDVEDILWTQHEVRILLYNVKLHREPISQSTISRMECKKKLRHTIATIHKNIQQEVMLSVLENSHCTLWGLFRDLVLENSPFRILLVHKMTDVDFG